MMGPGSLKITSWLLLTAATLCSGKISQEKTKVDWTICVNKCHCMFADGRRQANCERAGMNNIPSDLSEDVQVLVFNHNNINVLESEMFRNVGLIHLHQIHMKNCSIEEMDKHAFTGLALLTHIDLSDNRIKRVDPVTFRELIHLRFLNMNNNLVQQLEDELLMNLPQLQGVEFDNNRLSRISDRTFVNLPKLRTLKFKNNELFHIKATVFQSVNSTARLFLELQNNPWRCDCQLREFFEFVKNNSFSNPTYCSEPDKLRNKSWESLQSKNFACTPIIAWPKITTVEAWNGEELSLSCQVIGDPQPEINWTFSGLNGRTLDNSTNVGPNGDHKYTVYRSGDTTEWCNVTISNFSVQDKGYYTCAAKNDAGVVEVRISTSLRASSWLPAPTDMNDAWLLLLCLIVGLICVLLFIFFVYFVCCRRGENFMTKKPQDSTMTANGDVTHHIVMEPDQHKTLLTAVNPVQKPPRKYDSSPQSENGGTELTELNRNLLDDNSVQAGTSLAGDSMDDRRSTNSLEPLSSCNSQDNLLLQERPRIVPRSHHPPDLLAFSSRRQQASPANSLMSYDGGCGGAGDYSTISRFRHLQSPVRSPIYQQHPSQMRAYSPTYETLVYGRTQSPFSTSSAVTPIVSHRAGYVTVPRRPRVPSWSSAPTPTLDEAAMAAIAAAFKTEPVYDNLGPRTTADGSSVLSLTRKVAAESPASGANLRTRPLPPAPLYTSHTLPNKAKRNVFLSIRENEEPHLEPHFHPVVREPSSSGGGNGVIKPLPLQYSPPSGEPLIATTSTPDKRRASWATTKPETGTLRRPSTAASSDGDSSPTSRAASGASKIKVPPKPPPKPKKNGPLFEDEGEDGTEV